jgi:hypothetical protein
LSLSYRAARALRGTSRHERQIAFNIVVIFFLLAILFGCASMPKSNFGKPTPVEYRTWAAQDWVSISDQQTKACDLTVFAMATKGRPVRLVVDGVEQELDTSWTIRERVAEGTTRTWSLEFLEPIGGEQLACRSVEVNCVTQFGAVDRHRHAVRPCEPAVMVAQKKGPAKPELRSSVSPALAMFDLGIGGADVTVRFNIHGPVNEAWHCPRLEVTWPDGTRTMRESDCEPWPAKSETSWAFGRIFPGGTYLVRGCLSKAGRTLTCADATVRVVGGE